MAREKSAAVFEEAVKDAGGIHFFCHYEQIVQLIIYGLDKVVDDIVKQLLDHGWSKDSCKKLLKVSDGEDMTAHLGMTMVEAAAISDFGNFFVFHVIPWRGIGH
eukprot:8452221-Ditylum_brightwellii.AAC.1